MGGAVLRIVSLIAICLSIFYFFFIIAREVRGVALYRREKNKAKWSAFKQKANFHKDLFQLDNANARRRKTPPPKLGPRLWARRREKIFTLKSRRRAQTSKKRSLIVWRRIEEIGVEGLADDVDPDPDPDPDPDASATLTRHLKKGQPERSDRPSAKRHGARREKRSAGGVEKTVMATKQREDMLVKARQCRLLSTKKEREREREKCVSRCGSTEYEKKRENANQRRNWKEKRVRNSRE